MDAKQNLYYGFGEVAYAIAMSDGKVQREEYNRFKEIAMRGIKEYYIDMEYAGLIFEILDHQHMGSDFAYESGIKAMELGSHFLTPELKIAFLEILGDIAAAFIPVTIDEVNTVNRFKSDLERMTKNITIT